MYVRFVVDEIDEDSGVERGIFQAMYRLSRAGQLAPHEEVWWADVRGWFNLELEKPERLARSRRVGAAIPAPAVLVAGDGRERRRGLRARGGGLAQQ